MSSQRSIRAERARNATKRIDVLETEKATALDRIGRAIAAGPDSAAAHELGASISVSLVRGEHKQMLLAVKNDGPGGALIQEISLVGRPTDEDKEEILTAPLPLGPVSLLPGESQHVRVYVMLGTPLPLEVFVR
jgi:stage III sporulation protein SpoIIIAA